MGKAIKTRAQYRIVGADYSAQEPRITAFISQDPNMIQAYEDEKDLYAIISQTAFENNYEDNLEFYPPNTEIELDGKKIITGKKTHVNKAGKERRGVGKVLLLASTYGMSPASAGARLNKTRAEGEKLLNNFFGMFKKVKESIEYSKSFLREHGYVEDWAGRRRHLPDIYLPPYEVRVMDAPKDLFNPFIGCDDVVVEDARVKKWQDRIQEEINKYNSWRKKNFVDYEEKQEMSRKKFNALVEEAEKDGVMLISNSGKIAQAERQCFNARIQGGAATLTKVAMINIFHDKKMNDCMAKLIIPVHDELLVECPEFYADEVEKRLPEIMVDCAKPYINVPMKCDPANVQRWGSDSVAVAIRDEFKKRNEGNPDKGIPPMEREEALRITIKNHPEFDAEVIIAAIEEGKDLEF